MTGPLDVLEGGPEPRRRRSRLLVAVVVLAVLLAGGVRLRTWLADRELRQAVELTTTFGVDSSSTSPPGGAVRYFLVVRNAGRSPIWVTSVDASSQGLRVRMQEAGAYRIDVSGEVEIVLSAQVTCAGDVDTAGPLPASLGIRRADGSTVTRRVELRPASLVLDVAATLCETRPGLRDHELSGPVVRRG